MSDKQMDVKLGDFMLNYNDLAMHRNICNDIGMHKKRSEEHLETSLDFRDNNTIVHPVRTTSDQQSNYDKISRRFTTDDSDLADDSTSATRLSSSSLLSVTSASTSSFYPTPSIANNNCDIGIKIARDEYNSQKVRSETSDTSTASVFTGTNKYTAVQNRMHELCEAIEDKERLLRTTKSKLVEKDIEIGKLHEKISALEANCERLQSVVESLRDEAGENETKLHDIMNDRDDLLVRNASLSRQIEYEEREWSIERERLSIELDDVTRELELQKMILNGESISEIVQRWQSKVFELEGMIADRDRAIRAQQQRISKLKQSLAQEFASSNESLISLAKTDTNVSVALLKRIILQLLISSNEEQMHQLRALSNSLHLTDDEERQIWENLKPKINNT